jgi:hypothetical protein
MSKYVTGLSRFDRTLLASIAILLALIATELWCLSPEMIPAVAAQIPDTAFQRRQVVEEMRQTNRLLADIHRQLSTKVMKVQLVNPDKGE